MKKSAKQPKQQPVIKLHRRLVTAVLSLVGLTGMVYSGLNLYQPTEVPAPIASQVAAEPAEQISPLSLPASPPIGLRIPSIAVDTGFETLGLQENGNIEKPRSNNLVGWFKLAPTPGEIGPAVVVGHVDSAKDGPAVFWRLGQLRPGSLIEIKRQDSTTAVFRVDRVSQFSQSAFPADQIYGNIGHSGIRLITCSGDYNGKINRYSHNTVVFGSLVSQSPRDV